MGAIVRRLKRVSPRSILLGGLALFWLYSWPGFVGWDTREHLLGARTGIYTDGHPPAVARLVHISELFIAGPAGLLLIQSITLILGLYFLFKRRMPPQIAALAASFVFLFPPIAGVTALIAKDGLMHGFLMLGVAFLLDDRRSRQWLAVGFIVAASLMRWNALAATFAPMLLLFRYRPGVAGIRRYGAALLVWLGVTVGTYGANELLKTTPEYWWYWSSAYQDIAGTLEYAPPLPDAKLEQMLEGVPLRVDDHIQDRFKAIYNPAHYFQLIRGERRLFDVAKTDTEREAIARAWKRVVYGYPTAYLRYRWDNFELLIGWNRPPTPPGASAVYVWFTVIGAPATIAELEHDASPSKVQEVLRRASIWLSLTPLNWNFIYLLASIALLPLCRRRALETSLLLSGIGYELALFFLAQTTDIRYSTWMVLCTMTVTALTAWAVTSRFRRPAAETSDLQRE